MNIVVIKSLYCDYCRRYCDERCELCQYLKEAKLKPREEVDPDEEKAERVN